MTRRTEGCVFQGFDTRILACLMIMAWIFTVAQIAEGGQQGNMNQGSGMPMPAEAAGWKWDGKEMQYDSKSVFQYMDGSAELYLAYGFQNLRVRHFEKPDRPPLTLEFYEMASPEDAYGVFSFERQDEAVGIGQGSEFGGGLLRFWKGRHLVCLYADGEGPEVEPAILTLGRAMAEMIRETGQEPALAGSIPGKALGLVDGTVRYLKSHVLLNQRFFISHQNILNLSRKTEAVLAQYTREKQKIHLLLVRYPGVKEAGDAYRSFMSAYLPDAGGKDLLKTEDQKWTMARQRGDAVIVIFGASAAADAEVLFKAMEAKLPGGR
jgi:hypothetical protein